MAGSKHPYTRAASKRKARMKRQGRTSIILTLFVSLSPLIPQESPDSSYYPLGMGHQWNYSNPYFPHSETIVGTTSINGLLYYGLAIWGEQVDYWLREDSSVIYLLNEQDSSDFLLFDFDADTGDTWELPPGYECSFGGRITLTSKEDTVIAPADTFFNCYHFEHQPYCDDAGMHDTWFAKGVGKVRYFEDNIGGMMEYVLGSYTLATLSTYEAQSWRNNSYQLCQIYPNPFNPATTIQYDLPQASHVLLIIYDLLGREVEVAVNSWQEAGTHSVVWDATDVPSGIYFIKMSSGSFNQVRKVMVLR